MSTANNPYVHPPSWIQLLPHCLPRHSSQIGISSMIFDISYRYWSSEYHINISYDIDDIILESYIIQIRWNFFHLSSLLFELFLYSKIILNYRYDIQKKKNINVDMIYRISLMMCPSLAVVDMVSNVIVHTYFCTCAMRRACV